MTMTLTDRRPTMADAKRAAAAVERAAGGGLAHVLLYGSVARGEQHEYSDIDLLAVFGDLDYAARAEVEEHLSVAAATATRLNCEVRATDMPEWARRQTIGSSIERVIAETSLRLLSNSVEEINWNKAMVKAMNDNNEALEHLENVTEKLRESTAHYSPNEEEIVEDYTVATSVLKAEENRELYRMRRIRSICETSSMLVELSSKCLIVLEGKHPERSETVRNVGHNINKALKQINESDRALLRRAIDESGIPVGKISAWRTEGTYMTPAERRKANEHSETYADNYIHLSLQFVLTALEQVEQRTGVTEETSMLRIVLTQAEGKFNRIEVRHGGPLPQDTIRPTLEPIPVLLPNEGSQSQSATGMPAEAGSDGEGVADFVVEHPPPDMPGGLAVSAVKEVEGTCTTPTLSDARRAAEVLIAEGATKVVLFGSLARGDARPSSDMDFLAVMDDLGDYSQRRNVWGRLNDALERIGMPFHCDIIVTDRPELEHLLSNVETSTFATVAAYGKVLADIAPQTNIDWEKELVMPKNRIEAGEVSLDNAIHQLSQLHNLVKPSPGEVESLQAGDIEDYKKTRERRIADVLACGHLALEMSLKALTHLEAEKAPEKKHTTGRLLKGLPEGRRQDMEGIMGDLRHNDVQFWHIKSTYFEADIPDDVPVPSEELAVRVVDIACESLTYTADVLEQHGGDTKIAKKAKRIAVEESERLNTEGVGEDLSTVAPPAPAPAQTQTQTQATKSFTGISVN